MEDTRVFSVTIDKCGDCPKCIFKIGFPVNHVCDLTGNQVEIHKIGNKCPLPKTKGDK